MPPLLKLLRPHQWTKNVFCFAGVVFGGRLGEVDSLLKAAMVAACFCGAASVIYIFNDISDRELDRQHPKKRLRPIASGRVGVPLAALVALILLVAVLTGAWSLGRSSHDSVITCLLLYLGINFAYCVDLKHRAILDVNCIASGFVLRVLSGIYLLGDKPTVWIVLCTYTLALLLALAKRRGELMGLTLGAEAEQRPVLESYSIPFLDTLINSAATFSIVAYSLFTVMGGKNPALCTTIPFVYYGIMRYKFLAMVKNRTEEPEKVMLKDRGMVASLIAWIILYLLTERSDVQLFR
ncbi:MAG: decaprenyl-phosphate phosphoribosyltransferase [Verrucomicrobiae bacterium]|nr:decaprenyl-phosphate phosphoribosyltransferase [Verrucomicrobiae bacterium]